MTRHQQRLLLHHQPKHYNCIVNGTMFLYNRIHKIYKIVITIVEYKLDYAKNPGFGFKNLFSQPSIQQTT